MELVATHTGCVRLKCKVFYAFAVATRTGCVKVKYEKRPSNERKMVFFLCVN